MSVWDMRTVCDRCSFEYMRRQMRKETTGSVVCFRCYDGRFDLKRHPQNRPARPRREPSIVPDGRPAIVVPGGDGDVWTPFQTQGY
jgi:hypothetical protein